MSEQGATTKIVQLVQRGGATQLWRVLKNLSVMKITLEEMLALTTVIDTGSITAASKQLNQTLSGISRALSRLEEKLETTLLQRTTRRIALTQEGSVFLTRARDILAATEHIENEIALRRHKPAGRLRINAAAPFMLHVIVPLIKEFRENYPDISLELNTSDHIIDLLEQRTDIAIRIGELNDSTLHARLLSYSRLRVLASPAYLEKNGTPKKISDLAHHCLLGFSEPLTLNNWPLNYAENTLTQIKFKLLASSGETLRQLAMAGEGIVCLAHFMTLTDIARGDLVQILKRDTLKVSQPIHAVYYRNTTLTARIECFLTYLSEKLINCNKESRF